MAPCVKEEKKVSRNYLWFLRGVKIMMARDSAAGGVDCGLDALQIMSAVALSGEGVYPNSMLF